MDDSNGERQAWAAGRLTIALGTRSLLRWGMGVRRGMVQGGVPCGLPLADSGA
jgi:hypothetical protein